MTITASGKILKPLLIFKGARNGQIVQREFPAFEDNMIYLCQPNACWMDEEAMLIWVDTVLCPYVETAPAGVVPILFLDSYCCHMMASVVGKIQDIGVEVEHILVGGCTSLCQSVDIGVNKQAVEGPRPTTMGGLDDCGRFNKWYDVSTNKREHCRMGTDCNEQQPASANDTECLEAWPVFLVSATRS